MSGFGFRVSGFGFRVSSFGFRVSGVEFQVSGFVCRVSGFRFRVSGFVFRVSGSELMVHLGVSKELFLLEFDQRVPRRAISPIECLALLQVLSRTEAHNLTWAT